ncbi:hypothetical protein [Marmoricola sp. URHB0036]|uniref:hypothetical protein n=1 Tax=Marmoricola sp. URHB0036 TaxID=1298863 RepID=UPI000416B817|nr:hypothetical protein [Marmoricola sp. URHB0036]
MSLQEQLTRTISAHAQAADEPAHDLAAAVRRGRGLRRRRRSAVVAAAGLTSMVVLGAAAVALNQSSQPVGPGSETYVPVGQLDYSAGLRAFASPDENGRLWLGGRSFAKRDMGYLDTDATATPYGMVFFDHESRARLLTQEGTFQTLAPTPPRHGGLRLSAKADARLPLVAFTQPSAAGVAVVLYDLRSGHAVDTLPVPCSGTGCKDVRVDGLDRGLVFVRTPGGTFVWDQKAAGERAWSMLGTGAFRVADVRNGRVLWSGSAPSPSPDSPVARWHFAHGQIDAELSFDGRHVLYWSSKLKPVDKAGQAIRLKVKDAAWFTFDTDGSVLAATTGSDQESTVYDCQIPSGACERIGSVSTESGDPMFIGNDM